MPYIYIASPYTHQDKGVMQERYELAEKYAAILARKGEIAFSPIAYGHPLACRNELPRDFEYWKKFSFSMLAPSTEMHILKIEGWHESSGVNAEIQFARDMGKKMTYVEHYWSI